MQHKLYFAALLCGALCLTGCLKNEESPSVTQVRNAKATELESIAALNKANAEAIVTLANADAKLKEAQAKLLEADVKYREAEAKRVDAETALLKVQADLAQVNVDLAKEVLEIKKIELEAAKAELEALKAQYKAQIAAAEAEEAYWKGIKDQVAAEMELMAEQLKTALINAKAEQVAAQAAYDALLKQIDDQLKEEANEDLAALRERIAELSGQYTEASLELLEMKWDLYVANMQKAELEAGILSLEDYKNAVTEYNNNEIARIQKYLDYVKTYETLTSEELKDKHVDALIAYQTAFIEYQEAAQAADEEKEAWQELVNEYVYTYPTKFYQKTTEVQSTSLYGDYSLYDIAWEYITDATWDEEREGWHYVYKWDEVIDEETGETEEKEVELYIPVNMVSKAFVYPELPEGIEEMPTYYESELNRVIYPLALNKEGFQTIVDQEVGKLEEQRADWQKYFDDLIALRKDFIDFYATPVGQYKKLVEEADARIEAADKAYDEKYDAWKAAVKEWNKANEVENMLEIQETLAELEAEIDVFDDIINGTDVAALEAEKENLLTEIEYWEEYKAAKYETEGKYPGYQEAQSQVVWFTTQYQNTLKAIEDKQGEKAAAEGLVAAEDAKVEAAMKAVEAAKDAYYQAERTYYADPTNTEKATKYDEALAAYNQAIADYNAAVGVRDTKQADVDTIDGEIEALKADAEYYKGRIDYWQGVVDRPDKEIKAANDRIAEIDAEIAAFNEAYEAQANTIIELEETWAELYDFFMESETGEAAINAYNSFLDAYYEYYDAVDAKDELVALYSNKYENFFEFIDLYAYGYLDYPTRNDDEYYLEDFYEYFDQYPEDYTSTIYDLTNYDWYGFWLSWLFKSQMSVVALTEASDFLAEQIKEIEAVTKDMNEVYDEAVASVNGIMDLFDDVTATENVYLSAIENANATWQNYIELFKVKVDKYLALVEAAAEEEAIANMLDVALNIEDLIADGEEQIAALKDEIAELETTIKTAQDAISIMLEPSIKLAEEQIAVLEKLVESLKAELDAALAELPSTPAAE